MVFALVVVPAIPTRALAAAAPACRTFVLSPDYARDSTIFCTFQEPGRASTLAVSTDRGRSWRAAAVSGLTRSEGPGDTELGLTISPDYRNDRALFASTGTGVHMSTDRGATFRVLDPIARGGRQGNPRPFIASVHGSMPSGLSAEKRLFLAFASTPPARIDVASGAHVVASGPPGFRVERFVLPTRPTPAFAGVALAYESTADGSQVLASYRCTHDLTCAEKAFTFPAGVGFRGNPAGRVDSWHDGKTIALKLVDDVSLDLQVWRSTNGGLSFARWAEVERLLAAVNRSSTVATPLASFATSSALANRLFLRVQGHRAGASWSRSAPPAAELYRSDDGGHTWRRVGYQLGPGQTGRRGNLPFNDVSSGDEPTSITLTPDGRLVAIGWYDGGNHITRPTVFCSLDGGARWTISCSR